MPYSSDFGISDPDYLKHSRLMINKCLHFFISIPFPSPTPSILITHTHPASYSPALLPCCHTPHKKKKKHQKKINKTFQDCIPCLPLNSSESDLYNFLVLTEFKKCFLLLNFALFCNVLFFSHHICW